MTTQGLNRRQARFVSAMIATRTVAEAAALAGIAERTAYVYLANPDVQAAIGRALDDVLADATRQVTTAVGRALSALEAIVADPATPPASRVAAARLIVDAGPRYRQTLDLATRVAQLEDLRRRIDDDESASH